MGSAAALAACETRSSEAGDGSLGASAAALSNVNNGSYNLHLENAVRFNTIPAGADPVRGQALFGLATDGETEDKTLALFQGFSQAAGGVITSNQRTCFTCHRGIVATRLGLPHTPMSANVPATDALFTGIDGDAQGDPDAAENLEQRALLKYRPNRFNPVRPQSDPFRQVFFWRKSITLVNLAFAHGFLNDGRARAIFETDRGAVFSHTQSGDTRFDDLFTLQDGADMEAFELSVVSDPRLLALRDPAAPLHQTLIDDPFYTVDIHTQAQKRGKKVFEQACMSCHNTPNVFNNLANVETRGNGERLENNPPFAPSVARTFNVGVAERNLHGLRFTHSLGGGQFSPIVIPLVREDGVIKNVTVAFDIGLAATTGRFEDVGRFKVPQLRGVKANGPYFHDNSAATLAEVVDYFNSSAYNSSKDGRNFPVHLSAAKRADLLEFLEIL
jgi:mono/diheme cytochrome c family protein